jgi:hypothetical protein
MTRQQAKRRALTNYMSLSSDAVDYDGFYSDYFPSPCGNYWRVEISERQATRTLSGTVVEEGGGLDVRCCTVPFPGY